MSHFMIPSKVEDHIVIIYVVSRMMCNFMITTTIVSNLTITVII